MKTSVGPNPMDRARYPIDPWRLVETSYSLDDLGLTRVDLNASADGQALYRSLGFAVHPDPAMRRNR